MNTVIWLLFVLWRKQGCSVRCAVVLSPCFLDLPVTTLGHLVLIGSLTEDIGPKRNFFPSKAYTFHHSMSAFSPPRKSSCLHQPQVRLDGKVRDQQVRLVSAEAERPNHPSYRGRVASQGGSASQGVSQPGQGVLHDNDSDMTP